MAGGSWRWVQRVVSGNGWGVFGGRVVVRVYFVDVCWGIEWFGMFGQLG